MNFLTVKEKSSGALITAISSCPLYSFFAHSKPLGVVTDSTISLSLYFFFSFCIRNFKLRTSPTETAWTHIRFRLFFAGSMLGERRCLRISRYSFFKINFSHSGSRGSDSKITKKYTRSSKSIVYYNINSPPRRGAVPGGKIRRKYREKYRLTKYCK